MLHLHYTNIFVTCSIATAKLKHPHYAKTADSFILQYLFDFNYFLASGDTPTPTQSPPKSEGIPSLKHRG